MNESGGFKINIRMIIGVVILALAVITIAQNTSDATIKFLGWSLTMSMWLVLTIMFILGMLLGGPVRSGIRKLRGADARKSQSS